MLAKSILNPVKSKIMENGINGNFYYDPLLLFYYLLTTTTTPCAMQDLVL